MDTELWTNALKVEECVGRQERVRANAVEKECSANGIYAQTLRYKSRCSLTNHCHKLIDIRAFKAWTVFRISAKSMRRRSFSSCFIDVALRLLTLLVLHKLINFHWVNCRNFTIIMRNFAVKFRHTFGFVHINKKIFNTMMEEKKNLLSKLWRFA